MEKGDCRLTVFFDDPFWVGVFERSSGGELSAAKVTFGAEPKDCEVYAFVLAHYARLPFSPPVPDLRGRKKCSPKRLQRQAKREILSCGTGTKSQQALKQMQEQNKKERKQKSREQKLLLAQQLFRQKQLQRKEKHKGH